MYTQGLAALIRPAIAAPLLVMLLVMSTAATANPGQYIAKQYTEALGRAPDPDGWTYYLSYLQVYGCNKSTLKDVTQGFFGSPEFNSRGYDHAEKVLTVYRAVLSREPDAGGFNYWVRYLNNGNSLASMIDLVFHGIDGGELSSAKICGALGYGWAATPPLGNTVIPAKNDTGITSLGVLKSTLANATPGSTVYMAQRAVFTLTETLIVKPGVTLTTVGAPPRTQYAKQARLVRGGTFGTDELNSTLVRLDSGAKLSSVWVSGQAPVYGYQASGTNVSLYSGTATSLMHSRLDNAIGWTAAVAHRYGRPCRAMLVSGNLITGYSDDHHYEGGGGYTDGISSNCEDLTASDNDVIDASDVGIIVFAPGNPLVQRSQVRNNTVISAGVPAFSALMFEPQSVLAAGGATSSFAGAAIANNMFWAAPDSHFDFGLMAGATPWDYPEPSVGDGAAITGNSNAGISTPMYVGLFVDGMTNAIIAANSIQRIVPMVNYPTIGKTYINRCGVTGDMLAHAANGHASTSAIPYSAGAHHGCVGHPRP